MEDIVSMIFLDVKAFLTKNLYRSGSKATEPTSYKMANAFAVSNFLTNILRPLGVSNSFRRKK